MADFTALVSVVLRRVNLRVPLMGKLGSNEGCFSN